MEHKIKNPKGVLVSGLFLRPFPLELKRALKAQAAVENIYFRDFLIKALEYYLLMHSKGHDVDDLYKQ